MISQFFPVILCFTVAVLTGYFAVSLIDRDLELRFRLLFSIPIGFGISSVLYFFYKCLNIYDFHKYQLFEYAIVIVLAILYYNQDRPNLSKHKFKRLNNWFYVLNIYAISIFLQYFLLNPMGHWDGFRIWNTKAQFLLIESPEWHNLFRLPDFLAHSDYPLFLPSSTARLWMYQGGENYFSNVLMGAIFTFTVVYLLYQAVSYFKNEKVAVIVASLLMISDVYLYNGAGQCADVPLALFFLSAVVVLFLHFRTKRISTLILGVIFAGLSTWVKNEGLMFFAIYIFVLLGYFLRQKNFKNIFALLCSALPFAIFSLFFKKFIPVSNDLVTGLIQSKTYLFLLDSNRYLVVLKAFINNIFSQFSIFLALSILCLKGLKIKEKIKTPFLLSSILFVLMIISYVLVYVASPHEINWIVDNSLVRIMIQILPEFLLIFSLSLRIGKPDTLN